MTVHGWLYGQWPDGLLCQTMSADRSTLSPPRIAANTSVSLSLGIIRRLVLVGSRLRDINAPVPLLLDDLPLFGKATKRAASSSGSP